MKIENRSSIGQLLKHTSGSITLESAFIFPLFLLLLFSIILIGVLMLNVNTMHYIQLTAVERAAFNWDKFDRSFNSGIMQSEQMYGVYEHDLMLTTLSKLLQLNRSTANTTLHISKTEIESYPTGILKKDKLLQANEYLFKGNVRFSGELQYVNKGLLPRVEIRTVNNKMPLNLAYRGEASTTIADATQHIRGVDLLIYYAQKLSNMKDQSMEWVDKAKAALPSS